LLGLQPLTTRAYALRVLPATNCLIAGMTRSYKDNVLEINARRNVVCQQNWLKQ